MIVTLATWADIPRVHDLAEAAAAVRSCSMHRPVTAVHDLLKRRRPYHRDDPERSSGAGWPMATALREYSSDPESLPEPVEPALDPIPKNTVAAPRPPSRGG
jgi:hypothetical protein